MTDTNDRAQVPEGMVDVYIETMCLDRSPLNQQAIADLRVRVRIGLTAVLAAAPKPDRPSAEDVARLVKAAASIWLHPRSAIRCPLPGHEMVPDTLLDELAACLGAFESGPDGSWGDAAAARQYSQPDQPMPPPPSSARPENGSETMAGAARDVAAEDFAIMLRRMIWQTRKATGDDSMKVLAGQAEALLSRHGMPGNPLRADGPTPQPGEA